MMVFKVKTSDFEKVYQRISGHVFHRPDGIFTVVKIGLKRDYEGIHGVFKGIEKFEVEDELI